nr:hypothetical protein [Tanacetum cinerariifolium]
MSLYKVPAGILNEMKSIRRYFFNGVEKTERKMVWTRWENVLASKKNKGLGVSSFFSTNRSLIFKWIWSFLSHDSSLWSRFIRSIHGEGGSIENNNSSIKGSIWLDLVRDISSLKQKGVDLLPLAKRRLGNVAAKMDHPSLVHSFRRLPRGGIEEEQYRGLRISTPDVLLSYMFDRWWINLVPIKLNINAWKIRLDRLPTRFNLSSRGLDIPTIMCLL